MKVEVAVLPNRHNNYGLYGRKANRRPELGSSVKVEVAVQGSPTVIVLKI